jgi:hypothetical protein
LAQSNAYSIRAEDGYKLARNDYLSLNIVIPLFAAMRNDLPEVVKVLSSYGRVKFEGRFRFNHHIAFENELRKLIPNTDLFPVVIRNTLVTHADMLVNSFFLPRINNRTTELEKVGLRFYFEEF